VTEIRPVLSYILFSWQRSLTAVVGFVNDRNVNYGASGEANGGEGSGDQFIREFHCRSHADFEGCWFDIGKISSIGRVCNLGMCVCMMM
jgi:hypothetical protein